MKTNKEQILHKLLRRQLRRQGLTGEEQPTIEQWHNFLASINRTYTESDKDRYLLERSMEISSREMTDLNEKLQTAQKIANLGYWFHDVKTGENTWSKELYELFRLPYNKPVPSIEEVCERVHIKDRDLLEEKVAKAFSDKEDYDIEIRIKIYGGIDEYRWFHVVARPLSFEGQPVHALSGIAMDITRRKKYEEEVASLHHKLIQSAHSAGMAEVATAVLHNVGNILNSVNISLELIKEEIHHPYFDKLFEVEKLLQQHTEDLGRYLTQDAQGKLLPEYLKHIIPTIKTLQTEIAQESNNLHQHIEHIKHITLMQQTFSTSTVMKERANVKTMIEDAVKMAGNNFDKFDITLTINCDPMLYVETNVSKVLQILINLLQNAKDAVIQNSSKEKSVTVHVYKLAKENIEIRVSDTGIGISKANLNKIFKFGFTTKKHGHGFGLHSCLLAAKDLGGALSVHSDGEGKGAEFSFTLPITINFQDKLNDKSEFAYSHHR